MEYKEIRLRRLYDGKASIRDYVLMECLKKRLGIKFVCNGATMTIEWRDIIKGEKSKNKFKSKFNGKEYKIIDFRWIKDDRKGMELSW